MISTRVRCLATAALLVTGGTGLVVQSPLHGFWSTVIQVHGDITAVALNSLHFPPCPITKVIAANRSQDNNEGVLFYENGLCCFYLPNQNYRAIHHFDRPPSVMSSLIFKESRRYLMTE